jgi:hypothetical protein
MGSPRLCRGFVDAVLCGTSNPRQSRGLPALSMRLPLYYGKDLIRLRPSFFHKVESPVGIIITSGGIGSR